MSGTRKQSQLSILDSVFKAVDKSTAVFSYKKQIFCTSEKTLKKSKQPFLYFLLYSFFGEISFYFKEKWK